MFQGRSGLFLFVKNAKIQNKQAFYIDMANAASTTGETGEKIAADFLRKKGYTVLAMNYKNDAGRRLGEIDIIAKEKETLVFVEVKTREFSRYKDTLPEENITPLKLRRLSRIANDYLGKNRLRNTPYRFDAISVWVDFTSRTARIKHISHL